MSKTLMLTNRRHTPFDNKGIDIHYVSQTQLLEAMSDINETSTPLLLLKHSHASDALTSLSAKTIPLTPITSGLQSIGEKQYELWIGGGHWHKDQIKLDNELLSYCFNATYLIGSLSVKLSSEQSIERVSQRYYEHILRFMVQQGKPCPLRMWNYFPDINKVDHELERYQQFCVGRHNAFNTCAATAPEYPAASAVGSHSDTMTIIFIATVKSGLFLENPDQVSAYRYPREYSPKSPSFARASIFQEGDVYQLFISGTASIVGHESKFHGDIINQTHQTLKNLNRLIEHSNTQETHSLAGDLFDITRAAPVIKVYLKNPADKQRVAPLIQAFAPHSDNICYLEADICRQELDIEIEMLLSAKKS